MLKSSTFRQFKSNKILSQIRENDIENPIHALAFVILSVEQGGAKTEEDVEKSRQEPINNRTETNHRYNSWLPIELNLGSVSPTRAGLLYERANKFLTSSWFVE